MACANKGLTAEYMAQASGFFKRALALDPGNLDALVGTATVDTLQGCNFMTDDREASLAAAEATLNKALAMAPNTGLGALPNRCRSNFNQPHGPRYR